MKIILFISCLYRSTYICLSCIHYVIHSTCGILEPKIDLLPASQGFIAQLVEQRTGIAEVMGLNPVLAMKSFFQAKKQLLKLLRTVKIIPLISC